MTKLILVRHCQAQGNLERFFQGKIDSDITPKGREQIALTAEMLAAEPIDVFYTSDKQRARKSTDGINLYHNVPVITDLRLTEIDAGLWEGRYLTDIEKEFPEQWDNWKNHPEVFHAPEGESMAQVYDRVSAALTDILNENKGKTVCIVSHGCAMKCMMCFLHGYKVDDIAKIPLGTNMSVNVIRYDDDMKPEFLMEGYSGHLDTGDGK